MTGILLTKDFLRANNCNCFDIEINDDLVSKFKASMYILTQFTILNYSSCLNYTTEL